MAAPTLSCLGLLFATLCLALLNVAITSAEYPGVIELVGYSNRRARTHYMPAPFSARQLDAHTYAPPAAKTQADIETVKQNIEKYNKLLTLDTRNLPESQKDMLERIVERVARLKESLDVEETTVSQNQTVTLPDEEPVASTESAFSAELEADAESETDPTLVLDETTLLNLQTSMDELAAAQAAVTAQTTNMRELPTTTEQANWVTDIVADDGADSASSSMEYDSTTDAMLTDATDADDQYVAARSNNRNIAAITAADAAPGAALSSTPLSTTAGNQRTLHTSGKLQKLRSTKRPTTSTSIKSPASANTPYKRVSGQRPGSTSAALHKQTTTKQKLAAAAAATITTAQPYQKFKQTPQQTKVTIDKLALTPATPLSDPTYQRPAQQAAIIPHGNSAAASVAAVAAAAAAALAPASNYGAAGNEMLYDPQVNTSAIIDSLNQAREEFYQQKQGAGGNNKNNNNNDKKPSATAKPTKYHYYPHNQHIYLLPECAIQQVCNAVYVRLNYTQPLCACPSRYRDPCSASLNEDDQHTTKLVGDGKKKAITLAKTCEATTEMRECRSPKDWSLLALQNTRTGKSHYLVICRCPDHFKMEGPMAHDQPTYASVPGIRVFGMMCVKPGYSVHKPSAQPPKRYQLQKPFYRPSVSNPSTFSSSQYGNKDAYGRPTYGASSASSSSSSLPGNNNGYHQQSQDTFHNQQPSTYQYLNRPESSHNSGSSSNFHHPDTLGAIGSFNGGGSIYGRTNERKGETPIQAATVTESDDDLARTLAITTSTPAAVVGAEARTTLSEESLNSMETIAPAAGTTNAMAEGKEREKRSLVEEASEFVDDNQMPEFPWDRVIEFQQSIIWD